MTQELHSFAADLATEMGETLCRVGFLASGATCHVWKLRTDRRSYALRVIHVDESVLSGDLDGFLRQAVIAGGGRAVAPVLCSEDHGRLLMGKRWCLEALAEGEHPVRGALPASVCRQLGETLAALHRVPVRGFGRPTRIDRGVLIGATAGPASGVSQRFEVPEPAQLDEGTANPILRALPEHATAILACLHDVREVVDEGHAVLCHTDLHEKQMLCTDEGLIALIDFGGATILDRHWDLGSVHYFHGMASFTAFFEAYAGSAGVGSARAGLVPKFSVAIAMHHASRSRLPGKEHRLERAIARIRQVLAH